MIHRNAAGRKILERLYVEKQRATETKDLVPSIGISVWAFRASDSVRSRFYTVKREPRIQIRK
jgi:hypothetical protein